MPPNGQAGNITEDGLLGGKLRYRQLATGHRSGFEPVLLAASVAARAGDRVLEAGTGAGAGLLCLGHRVPGITGIGVEIAPDLAELAKVNFENNGFPTISCICTDIGKARFGTMFDHAMANPPWHQQASTNSPDAARALAHHAPTGLLAAWIEGLTRYLKPRGSLTLILPAASTSEAFGSLRLHQYGSFRLFPLWPRADQPAKRVIIAARLHGRAVDQLLPGLVLHDAAGITPAAEAILRDGAPTALAR